MNTASDHGMLNKIWKGRANKLKDGIFHTLLQERIFCPL
jgi:hypothetical protein